MKTILKLLLGIAILPILVVAIMVLGEWAAEWFYPLLGAALITYILFRLIKKPKYSKRKNTFWHDLGKK